MYCTVTDKSMLVFSTSCLQVSWEIVATKWKLQTTTTLHIMATVHENMSTKSLALQVLYECLNETVTLTWVTIKVHSEDYSSKGGRKTRGCGPEQLLLKVGVIAATPQTESTFLQKMKPIKHSAQNTIPTCWSLFFDFYLGCRGFAPCDKKRPPTYCTWSNLTHSEEGRQTGQRRGASGTVGSVHSAALRGIER